MEFRRLKASDTFIMTKIISKIGLKDIKESLSPASLAELTKSAKSENRDDMIYNVGATLTLDFVNIIMSNLDSCEKDIYSLFSGLTGMSSKEIADLDFVDFTEMIVAFVKKDEFKDFIGVVSKLFN